MNKEKLLKIFAYNSSVYWVDEEDGSYDKAHIVKDDYEFVVEQILNALPKSSDERGRTYCAMCKQLPRECVCKEIAKWTVDNFHNHLATKDYKWLRDEKSWKAFDKYTWWLQQESE